MKKTREAEPIKEEPESEEPAPTEEKPEESEPEKEPEKSEAVPPLDYFPRAADDYELKESDLPSDDGKVTCPRTEEKVSISLCATCIPCITRFVHEDKIYVRCSEAVGK